ncbi:hypothetical protein WJX73_010679 [Symbiochloris irregularis]|uniref:Fatty acyl-CoA reductase n=1 Tax=Symbiochloris irregularis TaxID=706552 RepID=A0AAW1PRJ3_9CHLO
MSSTASDTLTDTPLSGYSTPEDTPRVGDYLKLESSESIKANAHTGTVNARIWLKYEDEKTQVFSGPHRPLAQHKIEQQFTVGSELNHTTVLLTGATGYVGSLLLELILRIAPDVRKIYLLIRDKKGVRAQDRLKELISGPVFQYQNPDLILPKLEVVPADMTEPGCGLSQTESSTICRSVNYVIHCAAAIRFDMKVQDILKQTYAPTENLLKLAAAAPKMRCFCFISTAFVNANLPKGTVVEEKIYPLVTTSPLEGPVIGRHLLDLSPEEADAEADNLMALNGLQNTYFLAKNLTERMVAAYDGRPHRVCILRPSIIGSVARAPCPGFIGNSSGFTAAILGAAAGIVAFVQHDPNSVVTIVPGDMVASVTLLAMTAHGYAAERGFAPPCNNIVHACTSDTNPVTSHKLHVMCCTYLNEDPPKGGTLAQEFRVDWVTNPVLFWVRCLMHSILVGLTALMLRWQGKPRLAKRLSFAWEKWRELASSRFDFNIIFQTTAVRILQQQLGPEEEGPLRVSWTAEQDSWLRYLRTYVAGTKHLYRGEIPTVFDTQDYRPQAVAEK